VRRIAIAILVLLVGGGVAYLFHHNPHAATLNLGEKSSIELPMAAHILIALGIGAGLVLLAGLGRAVVQSLKGWSESRRERRADRVRRIREEGQNRLWAGDFLTAGRKLSRAAGKEPHDLETALALARSHEELGELENAQHILEAARAKHGPDPRLLSRLGNLALARHNAGAAIDAFREASAAHPESPRLLAELMGALAAEGRFHEAAAAARRRLALERQPARRERAKEDWLALRFRAAVAEKDTRKSKEELRRLVGEEPAFLPPTLELAARARAEGDVKSADRLYRDALRHGASGIVLERLAGLHASAGEPARALGTLRDTSTGATTPGPRLLLARALVAADHLDAAESELAELARESTTRATGVDIAPERDLVAGELALARGNDREAAKLFLRAATGRRTPFSFTCRHCGRTTREWKESCECGGYGTYEWSVDRAEEEGVQRTKALQVVNVAR